MGNHFKFPSRNHANKSCSSTNQMHKIKLLVIGFMRMNDDDAYSCKIIPTLIETLCANYYGKAIINCIFQCNIDRYGYLTSFETANAWNEKKHRQKLRNEQRKLDEWQKFLFLFSSSSKDTQIEWESVLNSDKFRLMIEKYGIPQPLRPLLWTKMLNIDFIKSHCQQSLFYDIANLRQHSPYHEEIWKDINKTCKNHTRFGLYSYSKEINQITPNHDDLYRYEVVTCTKTKRTKKKQRIHQSAISLNTRMSRTQKRNKKQRKYYSVSVGNLMKNCVYRKYAVKYQKYAVIDADSINRCGDHNNTVYEIENVATKTQLQLYNVLSSFCLYQHQIGYTTHCGLSMIGGLLLLYMSEENVFWALNVLCDENGKYKMSALWKPTMPDMKLRLFQMEQLIKIHLRKISNHFNSKYIVDALLFFVQNWFKMLFTQTRISHDLLFRIWDCYFCSGFVVLFQFALGILKFHECALLKSENIYEVMEILRDDDQLMMMNDDKKIDSFVKMSLAMKITQSCLDKLKNRFYSIK